VTIQTGDLAQHRPRLEVAQDHQLSLGPLMDDLQHTLFDQDYVFARIALLPQPRSGLDLGLLPQLRKQGSQRGSQLSQANPRSVLRAPTRRERGDHPPDSGADARPT